MAGKKAVKGKGKAASTPSKLAKSGKKGAELSEKDLKKVSGGGVTPSQKVQKEVGWIEIG